MTYSTSNPPVLIAVAPITDAGQTWAYRSEDDADTVDTPGYISNARTIGMRAKDIVLVTDVLKLKTTTHIVAAVHPTGPADLERT